MLGTSRLLLEIQLKDGHLVKGWFELPRGSRLKDILNVKISKKPFMEITQAAVCSPQGITQKVMLVVVNNTFILKCQELRLKKG